MTDPIAKQWATGQVENFHCVAEDSQTHPLSYNAYEAPLGDLLHAYLDHCRKPWWKRFGKWKKIEQEYREILNKLPPATWHERSNDTNQKN